MASCRPYDMRRRPNRLRALALLSVVFLLAGACADDDDTTADGSSDATTTVAADATGSTTTVATTETTTAADPSDTTETTEAPSAEELSPDLPEGVAAEGEAVKIGIISDGASPSADNTYQIDISEAMVDYLNANRGGLAGRPMELVVCETLQDPALATDCGNQMVAEGVAAVLMMEVAQAEAAWAPLAEADVPLYFFSSGDIAMAEDSESTFSFAGSIPVLIDLPIALAQEAGLDHVSYVVVDVPAATSSIDNFAEAIFEDAGITYDLIRVPLGAPDFTQQVTQVLDGGPAVATVIGYDAICIGVVQGLRAAEWEHPIYGFGCDGQSARDALGSDLEGLYTVEIATAEDDPGIVLYEQVLEEGSVDIGDNYSVGLNTFQMWMTFAQALQGLTDFTPAGVIEGLKTMLPTPVPADGRIIHCGGSVNPDLPALCSGGVAYTQLGADGLPTETLQLDD